MPPGVVRDRVQDHVAGLLRVQLVIHRRKAGDGVDFAIQQHLAPFQRIGQHPLDVAAGVEADIGGDAGQQVALGAAQAVHGQTLALEVADRPHAGVGEHLDAAGMQPRQHDDRLAAGDREHPIDPERRAHVGLVAHQGLRLRAVDALADILDVGEPLHQQELIGDILRRVADHREFAVADQADAVGLGRRLGRGPRWGAAPSRRPRPTADSRPQPGVDSSSSYDSACQSPLARYGAIRRRGASFSDCILFSVPLARSDCKHLHLRPHTRAAADARMDGRPWTMRLGENA